MEMANNYEVELKFPLQKNHPIEQLLLERGAIEKGVVSHVDRYFNHPSRDFRSTDEAFRIRSVGSENFVTYKGALLGSVAKSRHEIEVGIAPGTDSANLFFDMVKMLGFRFVREVCKSRRSLTLAWNQNVYELAIDDVPGIGRFFEIELIAEAEERETAEAAVWELATSLGLSNVESRSYLDMLLQLDSTAFAT